MKIDNLIFKRERYDHAKTLKKFKRDELFDFSRVLYLSSSFKSQMLISQSNSQKYIIMQKRSTFSTSKTILSKSTMKNALEEKIETSRDILSLDASWVLMKVVEATSLSNEKIELLKKKFKKLFKRDQWTTNIRKTQKSKVLLKFSRRHFFKSFRRFKDVSFKSFDSKILKKHHDENNQFLNVVMIDVVVFHKLINKKNKKKFQMFFMTMQQIDESLTKARNETLYDFLKLNALLFLIIEKIKRKCFDFLHKFESVLNLKKIEILSRHDVYDHKIELTRDAIKLSRSRVYSLLSKKLEALNKYLKKNLFKEFINLNKILFVSSILFVVKSNEQLKLCVNYRKLNVITKRNEYSMFLIKKTLTRVIECKHIFKLNIIFVFNRLRMNLDNEKFITFIIFLKIYKYHVLFFDLTNELVNWQHYMNDLLFEFLNKFCQVYLDDIFIYNKIRKKHERHLKQIFIKLKQVEFQMNINKCKFFKTKIVFWALFYSQKIYEWTRVKFETLSNKYKLHV